jgi:hypothetical protein
VAECRTCKGKLVYLTTPKGALMPAQKVTQVYTRVGNRVLKFDPVNFLELPDYYINHFQVCPHASEHHRKEAAKDAAKRPHAWK